MYYLYCRKYEARMFEFHANRRRYFDMQVLNAEKSIIPFISKTFQIKQDMRVLEIGCGEGGVLKAFVNHGCIGVGVDLDKERVANAMIWLSEDIQAGRLSFVTEDIYKPGILQEISNFFDIIILKDVIEHIHDQPRLMAWMKNILSPGGVIFFGFPPWQMPFGGHQQICRNKWLSKMPYYHLLPRSLYKAILKKYKEPVDDLLEIRDTRISIERFERIVREGGYKLVSKAHYILNPIYELKFGWKPMLQLPVIRSIPYFRNYLTTCVYYLIGH
jgi:SAM-dependent methyltransferase